jgi:uncharacterized protein (DUF1800 family)
VIPVQSIGSKSSKISPLLDKKEIESVLKRSESLITFLEQNQPLSPEYPLIDNLPREFIPVKPKQQPVPLIEVSTSITTREVDFDLRASAHLLRRITFGPTWEEINSAYDSGLDETVSSILEDDSMPDPPGEWINDPFPNYDQLTQEQIDSLQNAYQLQRAEMRSWLIDLMLEDETNIREMMSLFWHDHFAVSAQGFNYPPAMYHYYDLIRENSLGNLKSFVKDMALDPAMLVWLDNRFNRVNNINENFARELLELFTIGEGNYTQEDIIEAARAYTGYVTNGLTTYFIPDRHDYGEKTFMGQTGYWFGDDIVDIIFEQEETARFFARKLFQWFVYYNPNENTVEELAEVLRVNDFEVKPFLETLLKSELFYDEHYRGAKFRGGILHVVSSIRQLYIEDIVPPENHVKNIILLYFQEIFGQAILYPPDVSGWSGYRNWINTYTLPYRKIFTNSVIDGHVFDYPMGFQADALNVASHFPNPNDAEQLIDDMILYFYDLQPTEHTRQLLLDQLLQGLEPYNWSLSIPEAEERLKGTIKLLMRYPDFQLK